MRIYVIGSHSVGKSTLVRYISNKYNIPMISEMARQVLSEKELQVDSLRTNLDVADDYQNSIFYRQLEQEKKYEEFVSDRSFDCLAYTAQHSRSLSSIINSNELKEYIEKLKLKDSLIFYIRPSKATLKQDGVRESLTWDGIVTIDSMVKFMLEMFDLRYFQISSDSMQERVKLVDGVISLYKIA